MTPALIALAWLFQRSPVIIPIPGTSSLKHLEENAEACRVALSAQDMAVLDKLSNRLLKKSLAKRFGS
nr:aldo/keto reductase [Bradyrhizobium canariense]